LLHKRIKIDTANVAKGMYVAQLDCSWLVTPFIQRGFEVSNDNELELLRKFCKFVYVDASRSTVSEKDIESAHNDSGSIADPFSETRIQRIRTSSPPAKSIWRIFRFLKPSAAKQKPSKSTEFNSVAVEAPLAMDAYVAARAAMEQVVKGVEKGRPINIDLLHHGVAPMIESVQRNADAMAWLGFMRKRERGAFVYTMTRAVWAVIMGRSMGLEGRRLSNLVVGALLLDIGNVQIPETISGKDGPLTQEEFDIVKMHVDYGIEIIEKSPGISQEILDMVRFHHERLDGSGYPQGCEGDEIPPFGRIAGVIDSYDAMISKRPYASQKCAYDAVRTLNQSAGVEFQKEVIEQFTRAIGMFPTGSLVELNTGEVALVVQQDRHHRLRPVVMVLRDASKQPVPSGKEIELSKLPDKPGHKKARWIVGGFEAGSFNIDPRDYFLKSQSAA